MSMIACSGVKIISNLIAVLAQNVTFIILLLSSYFHRLVAVVKICQSGISPLLNVFLPFPVILLYRM